MSNTVRIPRLVVVESPYAGDILLNEDYARRAMHDCFCKGEAPFASHLLYTQRGVLEDQDPTQRRIGIAAGFAWGEYADAHVFYTDRGWSPGMLDALKRCVRLDKTREFRALDGPVLAPDYLYKPTQAKESTWRIRTAAGEYVHTAIDSSGMTAMLTQREHADIYSCRADAEAFIARLKEPACNLRNYKLEATTA